MTRKPTPLTPPDPPAPFTTRVDRTPRRPATRSQHVIGVTLAIATIIIAFLVVIAVGIGLVRLIDILWNFA